ncbi:imm11 family protein [Vibrio caribbeanicus]|uniref:imm11 family protein n=1 Tax=Vibrio caribbeanicus TaxID=701175 RepID=UPI0022841C83|nr:DUF1629 domain-containing protein [Vibrio caribbeanicus]MCY9844854.1 hypothetical protein [Vibrio caribbeanicus]
MKYYRLRDDINFSKRWYLGDIQHVDNWLYRDPPVEFMEPGRGHIEVYQSGEEMDFTLTERYAVPIVSKKFFEALVGLEEIDKPYRHVVFNQVDIVDRPSLETYFAMVIETQQDCVDESKSDFKKYEVDDPVRPDLAGQYSVFFNLVIDPFKTDGKHIFRVEKHLGAIIVSEEVKNRLEAAGITGVLFESVNK